MFSYNSMQCCCVNSFERRLNSAICYSYVSGVYSQNAPSIVSPPVKKTLRARASTEFCLKMPHIFIPKKSILCVDDQVDTCQLLLLILRDYDVLITHSVADAKLLIPMNNFSLFILDPLA